MSRANESGSTPIDAEPANDVLLLQWTTHPAADRPVVTILVSLLLMALVFIVYLLTFSAIFTIGAAVILWGSLTQYFLKTSFAFTEQQVRVKYVINKIEKSWSQYRSYYIDRNGILLSPFVRPSRLENFRGLYVRFAGNRDEVVRIVKDKIKMIEDID